MRQFLKPSGKIIPQTLSSYIELINARNKFYGLKFSYDSRPAVKEIIMSKKKKFDEIDFTADEPINLHTLIKIKVVKGGVINAVRITGQLEISPKIYLQKTKNILMPEIVFLKDNFKAKAGDSFYLEIKLNGGTDPLHANFFIHKKITSDIMKKCNYLPERIRV